MGEIVIRTAWLLCCIVVYSWLGEATPSHAKPPPGCKEEMCILSRAKILQCRFQIAKGHKFCRALLFKKQRVCQRFRRCYKKKKARCVRRCKKKAGCLASCVRYWKYRCIRRSRWRCRIRYYRCRRKVSKDYRACLEEYYGTKMCCKRGRRTVCSKNCLPLRPDWKRKHWK